MTDTSNPITEPLTFQQLVDEACKTYARGLVDHGMAKAGFNGVTAPSATDLAHIRWFIGDVNAGHLETAILDAFEQVLQDGATEVAAPEAHQIVDELAARRNA